ncbi:3-keto-5-aminohexanoate cleavage protein [Sporomusa termitida]|uniref:3-keto-5-aminohexanoate cleavage enzyme n=1 Tax=Sporomusa termitida TaxID=2377 RepID=A0A517DZ42_9FIRM|nr:3-keto-5-aminohexanoate cleavage protein [Sporomusa termitida]QDR82635.1 3-keto-5-aminohexanoate cleavage enzyme [Sporomusa termitida]
MNKVLISVAPVASTDKNIVPADIAAEVVSCWQAGAAMVHLHVRDAGGNLTADMSLLAETLRLIRKESDIIIEVSTGGVSGLTIQERCVPLYSELVEACSLNVGSTNLGKAVYCNPLDDVEYCIRELLKMNKTPEVEVFEIGHIFAMKEFMEQYNFCEPVLFSIVLGHKGEAPATPQALAAMIQMIPAGTLWGITHANRRDFSIIAAALGLGASTVRIGFEDSNYLDANTIADSNVPLVAKTVRLLQAMDKEPMSPAEARKHFNIFSR